MSKLSDAMTEEILIIELVILWLCCFSKGYNFYLLIAVSYSVLSNFYSNCFIKNHRNINKFLRAPNDLKLLYHLLEKLKVSKWDANTKLFSLFFLSFINVVRFWSEKIGNIWFLFSWLNWNISEQITKFHI